MPSGGVTAQVCPGREGEPQLFNPPTVAAARGRASARRRLSPAHASSGGPAPLAPHISRADTRGQQWGRRRVLTRRSGAGSASPGQALAAP